MKLIALRNFRNVGGKIKLADAVNELHIHKGAVFEIGKAATHEELQDESEEDAKLVYLLNLSHAVGDANDKELVRRVQSEAAAEIAADERRLKATPKPAKYV